jgi:hypothetical protein
MLTRFGGCGLQACAAGRCWACGRWQGSDVAGLVSSCWNGLLVHVIHHCVAVLVECSSVLLYWQPHHVVYARCDGYGLVTRTRSGSAMIVYNSSPGATILPRKDPSLHSASACLMRECAVYYAWHRLSGLLKLLSAAVAVMAGGHEPRRQGTTARSAASCCCPLCSRCLPHGPL